MLIIISGADIRGRLVAGGGSPLGYAGTLATSGTKFTVTTTCPDTSPADDDAYTVEGDTLKLYDDESSNAELVYVRTGP